MLPLAAASSSKRRWICATQADQFGETGVHEFHAASRRKKLVTGAPPRHTAAPNMVSSDNCRGLEPGAILGYSPASWNPAASHRWKPSHGREPFISRHSTRWQAELSRAQDLGSYHLETMLGRRMASMARPSHKLLRAMPP